VPSKKAGEALAQLYWMELKERPVTLLWLRTFLPPKYHADEFINTLTKEWMTSSS
jgi:hypothetical protein